MKKANSKYLKDYEAEMITALFYSYTRQLPTLVIQEIDRIYMEETGNSLNINYYCSTCIVKLLKQTAIIYFKDNIDSLPDDLKDRFKSTYKIM